LIISHFPDFAKDNEFRILRGGSRLISKIKTFDLRRADFALFKELL